MKNTRAIIAKRAINNYLAGYARCNERRHALSLTLNRAWDTGAVDKLLARLNILRGQSWVYHNAILALSDYLPYEEAKVVLDKSVGIALSV